MTRFLVPELMKSMNFTGWGQDEYYGLYDQLIQALDPAYDMPPDLEMGSNNNNWSPGFLAKKRANQNQVNPGPIRLKQVALGGDQAQQEISDEDRSYMMRYMQLKYSILFLQQYRYLGKYCFYGCWCLPNGVGDIGAGQGQPVDNIDRSCREYSTCYQCMYNQQVGGSCKEDSQEQYIISGQQEKGKIQTIFLS